MLNAISVIIIPFIVGTILLYGWLKGEDIYSLFIEGAKEGLKTSMKIMPYLIAIFIAVGIFRASGAMNMMQTLFEPVNKILKIPEGILPLIIIRPISGSGALGAVKDVLEHWGPDSFQGRVASIMMGSTETIFYTISVYFGSIGVKDYRYTLKAALISYAVSIFSSILIAGIFFR